jgi:hypothetical protein
MEIGIILKQHCSILQHKYLKRDGRSVIGKGYCMLRNKAVEIRQMYLISVLFPLTEKAD